MHEKRIVFYMRKEGTSWKRLSTQRRQKEGTGCLLFTKEMKGKDAHTHIKALVALMDEDEKEALFKAAEEEGF